MLNTPNMEEQRAVSRWRSLDTGLSFSKTIKGVQIQGMVNPVRIAGNREYWLWAVFRTVGEDTVVVFKKF